MLADFLPVDKVSLFALGRKIGEAHGATTIAELASRLDVALMSEARNRSRLIERLQAVQAPKEPMASDDSRILSQAIGLIGSLLDRSGGVTANAKRAVYAPWLKELLVNMREAGGLSWDELARLTDISAATIEGFRRSLPDLKKVDGLGSKHTQIADAWHQAPPWARHTLDTFWSHLGQRHGDLEISFKEMRQILIDLGLKYPRGLQPRNNGAQVKHPFGAHAVWEGDGKLLKIRINDEEINFLWYAFVDQTTTLLVGSAIGPTESAATFLAGLRDGHFQSGTFPIGVLIDNRLGDTDLSAVQEFCREHRIVIVRTFPGSSKTNGNIENNFSIFERFVGPVEVRGNSPQELARSVAAVVIEIFTQLRNHTPRGRLRGSSPANAATDAVRPEQVRTAIETLSKRLLREERDGALKWALIDQARGHFGPLSLDSEAKIRNILGRYTPSDIIAAQAAYLAQIARHPDHRYGPEYFLAILRHKREEIAKSTYNAAYRAGIELKSHLWPEGVPFCPHLLLNEIAAIQEEKAPAARLLRLDAVCWLLVQAASKTPLWTLWRRIQDECVTNRRISVRWWAAVNEYVSERLGDSLYMTGGERLTTGFDHAAKL